MLVLYKWILGKQFAAMDQTGFVRVRNFWRFLQQNLIYKHAYVTRFKIFLTGSTCRMEYKNGIFRYARCWPNSSPIEATAKIPIDFSWALLKSPSLLRARLMLPTSPMLSEEVEWTDKWNLILRRAQKNSQKNNCMLQGT